MDLEGKVALITGASSGMGRATAVLLAAKGARVMAVARREQLLEELAAEIGAQFVVADLGNEDACVQVVEETRRRLGPVDILVNNAGGGTGDGSVLDVSRQTWHDAMAINLHAPFVLTQLSAEDMVKSGWGRVVTVSSTSGETGTPRMVSYCSSKHGVIGLMRAAAADLAPYGVTCNAVLPGYVKTEATDRSAAHESAESGLSVEQIWEQRIAAYPAGRLVTVDEIAGAILILCSDAASGVSGQAITLALGGMW